MALVLPSTVEELNQLQHNFQISSRELLYEGVNKGFENIPVEKRYKREVSLPNGVENWNIGNIDSYLNFEDNLVIPKDDDVLQDRLVPEDGCSSFSSSMDDGRMLYHHTGGYKTFNTICMDSGSTCISSDHSYVTPPDSLFRGLEAEETYQNLDSFLQQVPEMTVTENLPSPLSGSDNSFDIPCLQSGFSLQEGCSSRDSFMESQRGKKRPVSTSSEEDLLGLTSVKQICTSPPPVRYHEIRRKNNIASKNCRKTRKEKQKEMEQRVSELEKEKEGLSVEVQVLEELIQAHKMQLYAILQKR